jgi:hypothetical protein
MDGPDLKPRWKKWLGMKLEGYANELKPIDYCLRGKCRFYNIATMNALNSTPCLVVSDYDIKKIEQAFLLSDGELFEARMHEDMARRSGMFLPPMMTVDGIVARTKEKCLYSVIDAVKPFVTIEEDRESNYPEIIVRGSIHVGVKRN